jgi:glycosyltransferase involved in cell wall biosynthesis
VPSADQVTNTSRSHLLKRTRIHVVPNGIDAQLFRPRPEARGELGLGPGPLFVCVGRLSRGKGVDYALHALAELDDGQRAARLVVVGDGEDEPRLRRLVSELALSDRVIFAGRQTPQGVADYLAASDVFLFPTTHAEAAPLVLLQAMASGVAVIASDLGAIPEVVGKPGENALLVPAQDAAKLGTAMGAVLQDEALRLRLGPAARERVLAEFTVERMTERTVAVYRIAADRLRRGRAGRNA